MAELAGVVVIKGHFWPVIRSGDLFSHTHTLEDVCRCVFGNVGVSLAVETLSLPLYKKHPVVK